MANKVVEIFNRKPEAWLAALIGVMVMGVYLSIVAPTVCLWDCGEYVAAGHSLGVPHPPGNPLSVCINRTASIGLGFLKDPGHRMNIVTSFCGAIVASLVFLIIVKLFTGWIIGPADTSVKKLTVYLGGFVGSMFYAFGNTVLFSTVESEVNVPLLVPIMFSMWLALIWAKSTDANRDRFLLLIYYISLLGIGIHMYSMITLGPVFLFVILIDKEKRFDWRYWITSVSSMLIIYNISWFVWIGVIGTVLTLLFSFADKPNSKKWRFCFWIFLFALIGFSINLYIPIRSSLSPMIDENHPATWQAFRDYLERKQYGSESMITRMFWRRGTWAHQFGIEGHMGFGGFYLTQFFHFSDLDSKESLFAAGAGLGLLKLAVYLIPTAFMLWAWYYTSKKHWKSAAFFISMMLLCTVVMVLYMNFADGLRPERRDYLSWVNAGKPGQMPLVYREVRVRDYFYITGFAMYGLWIGIAVAALLNVLFNDKRKWVRSNIAPFICIMLAVSPALPYSQNVKKNSRNGDFLPFDFAYNLLMSCEKDGILITNGDNDTFPLWALQEAYGIRRDVRLVNLSLVNTGWYIKQLRDLEPKVPMHLTDQQIESMEPELNPFDEPTPYEIPKAGIAVQIPGRKQHNAILVQDKMILTIVSANQWKKPVYFASTVSDDNFMGVGPYLQMEGLAYRLLPRQVGQDERVNLERISYLIDSVYRFRGLGKQRGNYDETQYGLLSNYAACFVNRAFAEKEMLDKLSQEIKTEQAAVLALSAAQALPAKLDSLQKNFDAKLKVAIASIDRCISIMPWDWRPRMLKHEILLGFGKVDEAVANARLAIEREPENQSYIRMAAQAESFKNRMSPQSQAEKVMQ